MLGVFPRPEDTFIKAIVAPASVKVGEPFTMTITTTGSGCERLGDVGVLLGDRFATVMVYDFTTANRPDIACTLQLNTFKHEVSLTFTQAGEAVVRVWGRIQTETSPHFGEPSVIEHKITVR